MGIIMILILISGFLYLRLMTKTSVVIPDEAELVQSEEKYYDILISSVIHDRQRLEVMEEEFDYWYKTQVKKEIIKLKEGSLLEKFVPDYLQEKIFSADFNQSKADIVVQCKVSIEFELDLADDLWEIKIKDDTAYIKAPKLIVEEPNVITESIRSWVVEEEFIIDGEKEKGILEKSSRVRIIPYTQEDEFLKARKERCRKNLADLFRNFFSLIKDEKLQKVKHFVIKFADDKEE